jgi:large subunit ribosomal protein L33
LEAFAAAARPLAGVAGRPLQWAVRVVRRGVFRPSKSFAAGSETRCCVVRFRQESIVMAKGKKKVEVIHLVCEESGDHNYVLRRKTGGEKLKLKKYSPRLRKHTLHVEKKK